MKFMNGFANRKKFRIGTEIGLTIALASLVIFLSGCDTKVPNNSGIAATSNTADNTTIPSSDATNSSTTGSTANTTTGSNAQTTTPQMPTKDKTEIPIDTVAILHTNLGNIEIRFFPDKAPKTVASFLKLAKKGFYDKTKFHRVIPGFMIQGGDPLTVDNANRSLDGTGGPGFTVPAEFNDVAFDRGVVGLARSSDPNSGGSQFYIMQANSPHLNGQYTAFGQVVKGMDVVDKIVHLPRDARDNPLPKNPAIIESITISTADPKTFPPIPIIKK